MKYFSISLVHLSVVALMMFRLHLHPDTLFSSVFVVSLMSLLAYTAILTMSTQEVKPIVTDTKAKAISDKMRN